MEMESVVEMDLSTRQRGQENSCKIRPAKSVFSISNLVDVDRDQVERDGYNELNAGKFDLASFYE